MTCSSTRAEMHRCVATRDRCAAATCSPSPPLVFLVCLCLFLQWSACRIATVTCPASCPEESSNECECSSGFAGPCANKDEEDVSCCPCASSSWCSLLLVHVPFLHSSPP